MAKATAQDIDKIREILSRATPIGRPVSHSPVNRPPGRLRDWAILTLAVGNLLLGGALAASTWRGGERGLRRIDYGERPRQSPIQGSIYQL